MIHINTVIVMCMHQDPSMLEWHVRNFQEYANDSMGLVIHYNRDEEPSVTKYVSPNVIVSCNVVKTERFTSMLLKGFVHCMEIAMKAFPTLEKFIIESSGSGWIKPLQDLPEAALGAYNPPFDTYHSNLLGEISTCATKRHGGPWHWNAIDRDAFFRSMCTKRGFQWVRSSQCSGQVLPREVAEMLVEDIRDIPYLTYPCEEVYFSTYTYNYCKKHHIPIHKPLVLIDWDGQYDVKEPFQLTKALREGAYGVCKLSDEAKEREWFHTARLQLQDDDTYLVLLEDIPLDTCI